MLQLDEWVADRRLVKTGTDYQLVVGSAAKKTPNYLVKTHKTVARCSETIDEANNMDVFDVLNVNFFAEVGGVEYPRCRKGSQCAHSWCNHQMLGVDFF